MASSVPTTRTQRLRRMRRREPTRSLPSEHSQRTTRTAPPTAALRRPAIAGTAGAVLIAASSWWVGAVPFSWQARPPKAVGWFAIGSIEPRIAFYAGLALMAVAWLAIGRVVFGGDRPTATRTLQRIALAWATPMMLAVPLASRDLWAYAAQGNIIRRGLNPYRYAPIDLPGVFTDNVSPGWVHSPAPYGPFWLGLDHALAAIYGDHVFIAVFLLRIPALAGLGLLLWGVPRLAAGTGSRADRTLWLVAVNPFTIELVLAAGHNDILMAGLLVAAAAIALRGRALPAAITAAALMALAAGIKSPALLGVAFTVPLALSHVTQTRATATDGDANSPEHDRDGSLDPAQVGRAQVGMVTAAAVVSSVVTFAAITLATGFGLGWVHQVGSSARLVNWLSLPTDAAILADVVTGHINGASRLDDPMRTWRAAGLVIAAVLVAALWVVAMSVAVAHRWTERRVGANRTATVVSLLAAAMLTLTLLGPAVQLWYLIWALPFLGAVTCHRRALIALCAIQLAMVFTVDPHGLSFTMRPTVLVIIAAGALVSWLALRDVTTEVSAATDDDADGARPGVDPDRRGHLGRDELAQPRQPST